MRPKEEHEPNLNGIDFEGDGCINHWSPLFFPYVNRMFNKLHGFSLEYHRIDDDMQRQETLKSSSSIVRFLLLTIDDD